MEGALDFAFAMLIPVVLMATQHRPPAELDGLFAQLRASKNATSARVIVERIWECWVHHDAPDIRALMDQGLRDIEQHRYDQALKAFDEILERDPDFAEAWNKRATARYLAGHYAGSVRIVLLLSLVWIMRLTEPLFEVFAEEISGRDLIMILGGLFLLGKSTQEIHDKLEGESGHEGKERAVATFASVLIQILLLDLVFSLDSVITAVGMAEQVGVMITAIVIAVGVMMLSAGVISRFIEAHPTVKMLALSFLLLIGVALIGEGLGHHIPKGYIYFAMAFSVFVEMMNMRLRRIRQPIALRDSRLPKALDKAAPAPEKLP